MRRRAVITLLAGTAVLPVSAFGQQRPASAARIGLLTRKTDASVTNQISAFRQGLQDLGWIEGKNVTIEHRDAGGAVDRLAPLAAELVAHNVDVIVTVDTPPTQAAEQATSTIPIVIAVSADPVGAGLVKSLSHPGGNATGLSLLAPETDQKTLEVLKETLPGTKRVAMIFDPNNPGMMLRLKAVEVAAAKLSLELQSIAAPSANELTLALVAMERPDAVFVLSPIYAAYQKEIAEFATKTRVPLLVDTSGLAGEPGALLSYGADITSLFRRAATFVDKILRGAKPADLPVEQPAKFDRSSISGLPKRSVSTCRPQYCFAPTKSSNDRKRRARSSAPVELEPSLSRLLRRTCSRGRRVWSGVRESRDSDSSAVPC
jgi:putative tryptophan/tyrosine transport system substrate-binding protein